MTVPSLARSILGGEVSQHTPLLAVSKEDAHLIMQITGCHDLYREKGRGMITAAICLSESHWNLRMAIAENLFP